MDCGFQRLLYLCLCMLIVWINCGGCLLQGREVSLQLWTMNLVLLKVFILQKNWIIHDDHQKRLYTMFLRSIVVFDIKYDEDKFIKLNMMFLVYSTTVTDKISYLNFEQLQHTRIKHRTIIVNMIRKSYVSQPCVDMVPQETNYDVFHSCSNEANTKQLGRSCVDSS